MPGQGRSACAEGVREPGTHRARLWVGAWAVSQSGLRGCWELSS